jgi:serine protease AprX
VTGGSIVDLGGNTTSHLVETLGLQDSRLPFTGIDGSGIVVGVIDSGLSQTGTYNVRRFVDFTRPSRGLTYTDNAQPYDDYGHGTHVAGLIAANGAGSRGRYRGVAPGASVVGLKVLDRNGAGYTSDVLVAVEYAVTNRQALGLRVLNLSLGHLIFEPADRDPLVQAVEKAAGSGLIVLVSAGNFGCLPRTDRCGYAGVTSPGNAPSAITVGSIDTRQTTTRLDDGVATYSSRGPSWYDGFVKPDVVAPGHRLVSTVHPSSTLGRDANRRVDTVSPWLAYARLSGTSMATAVASGAVALVLDASERRDSSRGRLTPTTVKAIFEFTSFNVSGADELTEGAGALNAAGAMHLASKIDPSTPAGQWWVQSSVTPSTQIGSDVLPWTQRIIWGDRVAWGTSVYINEQAWAQTIVWGDTIVWRDTLIWADTIVWGDTYDRESGTWGNLAHSAPSGSSLPNDQ